MHFLKGGEQCNMRGVGRLASVRRWFQTEAIDVCLLFNVAVLFSSNYSEFPFPVCKAQFIDDWLENWRGAPRFASFFRILTFLSICCVRCAIIMEQGASVR